MAEVSLVNCSQTDATWPDDRSTLVNVMAWCRQAISHYLNQCWPRFMSPYGVTKPQWVKVMPSVNLSINGLVVPSTRLVVQKFVSSLKHMSHWCRIYESGDLASVGSGNGLSPVRRQVITWTNAGLLSIGHLGTNFSEIRIEIRNISLKKMHLDMSSVKLAAMSSRGIRVNSSVANNALAPGSAGNQR